ncbi:MAG TPA: DUF2905 domain-containing protein [Nitrospiraceae bacterium]|jgi:hypothetical protein|nr:DUF2905 domain-containing protein [Nitrospiraceae bacterium]
MFEWSPIGKLLIALGLGIALIGLLLTLSDKLPSLGGAFSWFGRLPGDISIKRDHFSFYFPIATSILLSVVLSLLLYLLSWLFRR